MIYPLSEGHDSFSVFTNSPSYNPLNKWISWAHTIAELNHVVYINPGGDDEHMMKQYNATCSHKKILENIQSDKLNITDEGAGGIEIDFDLSEYIE